MKEVDENAEIIEEIQIDKNLSATVLTGIPASGIDQISNLYRACRLYTVYDLLLL